MPKLTQRLIESLCPEGRYRIVFDETVPGFGVRVFPSGHKSYMIQYRSQKRTRRYTLGDCNILTPLQARKKAQSLLAGVLEGKDPAQERLEGFEAPTVADLVERFLRDHSAKKKNRSRGSPEPGEGFAAGAGSPSRGGRDLSRHRQTRGKWFSARRSSASPTRGFMTLNCCAPMCIR